MEQQELLNGLRKCKSCISDMDANQRELQKIRNSYRGDLRHKPLKAYWKGASGVFKTMGLFLIGLVVVFVLASLMDIRVRFPTANVVQGGRNYEELPFVLLPIYILYSISPDSNEFMSQATADDLALLQRGFIQSCVILLILLAALIASSIVLRLLIKRSINKYNADITNQNQIADQINEATYNHNLELYEQEKATVEHINRIKTYYATSIAPWFPPDYLYPDAVNFFIHALENQRAYDVRSMVNLYEDDCHKKRLEANQQKILNEQKQIAKQQMLGNLLTVGNLAMSIANNRAIDKNTEAVKNQRTSVTNVHNHTHHNHF